MSSFHQEYNYKVYSLSEFILVRRILCYRFSGWIRHHTRGHHTRGHHTRGHHSDGVGGNKCDQFEVADRTTSGWLVLITNNNNNNNWTSSFGSVSCGSSENLFFGINGFKFLPILIHGWQFCVSVTISRCIRGNQIRFARCIVPLCPGCFL